MSYNSKYRPKTFDEIVGQQEAVNYFKNSMKSRDFNHCIFKGKPGTGKTTLAEVIANEYDVDFQEFNASTDRTLTFVRDTVIPAMRHSPLNGDFKIIFLDESENMIKDAYQALRRPMEKYQHISRLIFSCNEEKFIEAVLSRCEVFRFDPLAKRDVKIRLSQIAENESLNVENEVLDELARMSKGDLRKAINLLERYGKGALKVKQENQFEQMMPMQ